MQVRSQAQALDLFYGCTPFYHLNRRGSGVGTHNSENSGNNGKGNENLAAAIPRGGSSCPLLPGRIWIVFFVFCLFVCLFFFCGGRKTRRLRETWILWARTRTNNKLNPHVTPGPGIEPRPLCAIPAPLVPSVILCKSVPVYISAHSIFTP